MINLHLGNDSRVAMQLMSSSTTLSKELVNQPAMFKPLKPAMLFNLETSTPIGWPLSLERTTLSLSIVLVYFFST